MHRNDDFGKEGGGGSRVHFAFAEHHMRMAARVDVRLCVNLYA